MAEQAEAAIWQGTLEMRARNVVADSVGAETAVTMNTWVETEGFPHAEQGVAWQAVVQAVLGDLELLERVADC